MEDFKIPFDYICPLSHTIMEDPVLMPDGESYERKAIEEAETLMSPLTWQPMKSSQAVPNNELKT